MALLVAAGQVNLSRGARSIRLSGSPGTIFRSFINRYILTGLVFVLTAPLLYIRALREIPLIKAFMFNSLTYLFVFLSGRFLLKEKAGILQWAGLLLIMAGFLIPFLMEPPL